MTRDKRSALEHAFQQIPMLCAYSLDSFKITPLSGYTNLNFRLKNNQYDWILRIPKKSTNVYIDRIAEAYNADIAFHLGLASKCLWRDNSGLSLCHRIKQSRALNTTDLKKPALIKQLATAIRQLHQSNVVFKGKVDIADLLSRYYSLMPASAQLSFANRYQAAIIKIDQIESISAHQQTRVPSHNDLVLGNLLLAQQKITIIDWEYAAMASPYWDLATLCNEGQFTAKQAAYLLDLYQREKPLLCQQRLHDYRHILNLLSTFWMTAFTYD